MYVFFDFNEININSKIYGHFTPWHSCESNRRREGAECVFPFPWLKKQQLASLCSVKVAHNLLSFGYYVLDSSLWYFVATF